MPSCPDTNKTASIGAVSTCRTAARMHALIWTARSASGASGLLVRLGPRRLPGVTDTKEVKADYRPDLMEKQVKHIWTTM